MGLVVLQDQRGRSYTTETGKSDSWVRWAGYLKKISSSETSAGGKIRKTGWVAALCVICRLARFRDFFCAERSSKEKKEGIPAQLKNKFSNLCNNISSNNCQLTFLLQEQCSNEGCANFSKCNDDI
jgi:hypothetical protein